MVKEIDPPMHTAEHILNQTMVRMFGCGRSFSAHIEKKKSKCDYKFGRMLTDDEKLKIEARVNEVIRLNLDVYDKIIEYSEASRLYDVARLHKNKSEMVRIVHIGDYDACPCSGLHVSKTGEIGVFRIVSADFADGTLRIRFKIGVGR
jgi:misacylated tRNA(Ala) deacylase